MGIPHITLSVSHTYIYSNTIIQISPKFGIFFCLACSGIHRGLGVHISFVRSATMDALKTGEVKKMELGGNKPWKDFFDAHSSNQLSGRDFEACTISERYDSEAGEEWKERLSAKVEGREFVPGSIAPKAKTAPRTPTVEDASNTPSGSGRNTPLSRITSPPQRTSTPGQKVQNEAFFARKGAENDSRPDHLAPNQGGKYGGFGSGGAPTQPSGAQRSVPTADDFQKDPMAALTKGFGWLSSTAANLNQTVIQPGVKSLQDGEFAAQAQKLGTQTFSSLQQGTKGIGEQFNRFVDPEVSHSASSTSASGTGTGTGVGGMGGSRAVVAAPEKQDFWDSFGAAPAGPPREKREFWDDFGSVAEQKVASKGAGGSGSLGTNALRNGGEGKKEGEASGWKDW
ncbi:ADP-ribosylation factor GTPase-activating protein gcs1 [Recurvomyces mirabilis]|uniref:ADP-ribosylation factor GTPase-activating protein gcs1 n=1 Tax=Recurvomyces mirabilis TaxID=574656 RepID=A0AAE0WJ02_9PEZI|nr:ADP-ribosylation factor GTPase-activating protein gcs1 [Recurvomyces mirabilis]KAK5150624.1 Zn finger-containing GTPase- Activating Protein for ARF [Recurvomyces mirabilis]